MSVNTRTLDHIVHLTPPGSVGEVSKQFESLGFRVLPGGTHADGLTANPLVVLADGVYLELISFTYPVSHYPIGSPERQKREKHTWASKFPGWIDFAFLGNGLRSQSISAIINERGRKEGSGVYYDAEQDGGRTRPDGQILKWLISGPQSEYRGVLPFFCGDVTSRSLRVPSDPPSNTVHPSTAKGIAFIRVLVAPDALDRVSKQLTSVIGAQPVFISPKGAQWVLDTPRGQQSDTPPPSRLVLDVPSTLEEISFLQTGQSDSGIYEVGFRVAKDSKSGTESTPYGKISWIPEL